MTLSPQSRHALSLRPVGSDNWRGVTRLEVSAEQRAFVAEPAYYLALCCYGSSGWQPLALHLNDEVVGFLMWTVDPADGSCWLGGIMIDRKFQGLGFGKQGLQLALERLSREHGQHRFALSYLPENRVAKALYASLGFVETGEHEDEEVVARRVSG